jgi:Ricin-type beta-trefoil lectin domain
MIKRIAVALAAVGLSAFTFAAPASAVTEFPWCMTGADNCIMGNGSGNPVDMNIIIYATNFASENGVTTNGHDYVQYYQIGSNRCLTDSGANVYLQTCAAQGADTRQMWWYDATPGWVVNDYATVHYGHNDCMSVNSSSGDAVIVQSCETNDPNQQWDHGS